MIRVCFYGILVIACSFGLWIVHHSAQDGTWISRQLYPLESLLSSNNEHCQGSKEKLLKQVLQAGREQGSLASQVAYLSPNGEMSWCASASYGETPNNNARYRYASLTKVFTAQALLTAMHEKNIPLNTPLYAFIPQARIAKDTRWQEVTVEQLLTHSAGLDRLRSYDPMTRHAVTPWCPTDLDKLIDTKLDFNPDTDYGYSNLTYCLLGVVLEKVTDQPYTKAIESLLNINTHDIVFVDGPYLEDEIQYDFRHSGFYSENYYQYLDFPALASSAGLSGTAKGLVSWLAEQRQNSTLTVTQAVWPESCDLTKMRACYGYSLFPYRPNKNLSVLVQQGYIFGASSSLVLDEHGGVFIWLGNGAAPEGSASDNILNKIYELLLKYYE